MPHDTKRHFYVWYSCMHFVHRWRQWSLHWNSCSRVYRQSHHYTLMMVSMCLLSYCSHICRQQCQYCSYSGGDFEVSYPAATTCCTDYLWIWQNRIYQRSSTLYQISLW